MKTFCHHFTGRVLLIKIDFNCHHTFGNHHKLMSENWFLIGDEKFDWEIVVMKLFKLQNVKQRTSKTLNNSSPRHLISAVELLLEHGESEAGATRGARLRPSQVLFDFVNWSFANCFMLCARNVHIENNYEKAPPRVLVESKQRKSAIKLGNENSLELLMT